MLKTSRQAANVDDGDDIKVMTMTHSASGCPRTAVASWTWLDPWRRLWVCWLLACVIGLGCETKTYTVTSPIASVGQGSDQDESPREERRTPPSLRLGQMVPTTTTPLGSNVYLETIRTPEESAAFIVADALRMIGPAAGLTGVHHLLPMQPVVERDRNPNLKIRVLVDSLVVCQSKFLEHFLSCDQAGKHHESVLSGPFDASHIHLGLLAAGAKPGKPASFVNEKREFEFKPATGDVIKVYVQYAEQGQLKTHAAQEWIINSKTQKPLDIDWVFAGSFFGSYKDDDGKEQTFYAANSGRVICTTNFASALLDLPILSADVNPEEGTGEFFADLKRLPPLHTFVTVILEPGPPANK